MKILLIICILGVVLVSGTPAEPRRHPRKASSHLNAANKARGVPTTLKNTRMTDLCYEIESIKMPGIKGSIRSKSKVAHTNATVRGLEKTLRILEGVAKDRKDSNKLKLPSVLQKAWEGETPQPLITTPPNHKIAKCPNAEDLAPCTCDVMTQTINCSATGNYSQIKEIFNTIEFPETSFSMFLLYGMEYSLPNETVLYNNTFGPVSFLEVSIENTNLKEVELDAFAGSEDLLEVIAMQHNPKLHTFPFQTIHRFNVLKVIKLGFGRLQEVPSLQVVPNLQTLLLNHNEIKTIGYAAFAQLPVLETLDLGMNALETIADDNLAFSAPDVLVYLDDNSISFIEDNAFSNEQPSLLDVSYNLLESINITVFKPILDNIIAKEYDSYVDASENPVCCKGIEWIQADETYWNSILLPDIDCSLQH